MKSIIVLLLAICLGSASSETVLVQIYLSDNNDTATGCSNASTLFQNFAYPINRCVSQNNNGTITSFLGFIDATGSFQVEEYNGTSCSGNSIAPSGAIGGNYTMDQCVLSADALGVHLFYRASYATDFSIPITANDTVLIGYNSSSCDGEPTFIYSYHSTSTACQEDILQAGCVAPSDQQSYYTLSTCGNANITFPSFPENFRPTISSKTGSSSNTSPSKTTTSSNAGTVGSVAGGANSMSALICLVTAALSSSVLLPALCTTFSIRRDYDTRKFSVVSQTTLQLKEENADLRGFELESSIGKDNDGSEFQDTDGYTVAEAIGLLGFGRQQWELLFITGACWISDAFELMLLAYLLPAVHKEWAVDPFWEKSVASISFLGMLFGSPLHGYFSDSFGRRRGMLVSTIITAVFGILSALSPNISVLLVCRFMVGIGVSGAHVPFSLLTEFVPVHTRGRTLVSLQGFWTVGSVLQSALAWVILPTLGWRWLLAVSALPALFVAAAWPFTPESPRFLLQKSRQKEAIKVLEDAARKNRGVLVQPDEGKTPKASEMFAELLGPQFRRATIALCVIWFANTFAYYGIVLSTPEYFNNGNNSERDIFLSTFITALAEFPGLLITAFLVDRIGRRKTQAIMFGVCGAFTLLFLFPGNFAFSILTAALSRMTIAGVFAATFLYTPEVYPTRVRSTGLGTCWAFSRIAALSTPYVINLFAHSAIVPVLLYAGICFLAMAASIVLPKETFKQELDE
ncbi:synaptic vesicle 2-related protein [Planoprotostelium fungivorum]|uniref:Synaptic vesicle 2-related protein n=1 Tax=Planoprotostelium fungivorum TaxID=1890364 RepID=A0A2P6NC16_9EUKA|nr:synaptic vesicle 2-related protein [Planoprotostelium fungivorum]